MSLQLKFEPRGLLFLSQLLRCSLLQQRYRNCVPEGTKWPQLAADFEVSKIRVSRDPVS